MTYTTLKVERRGAVEILSLNRPEELNALSPEMARKYENSEEEFPRELWREMADLGWLGMMFPGEYDGLECTFLDMYGLYVEMGRTLAPSPFFSTGVVAASAISRAGSKEHKAEYLPRIACPVLVIQDW